MTASARAASGVACLLSAVFAALMAVLAWARTASWGVLDGDALLGADPDRGLSEVIAGASGMAALVLLVLGVRLLAVAEGQAARRLR